MSTATIPEKLTKEIYEGFALNQTERWNAVVHADVVTNSPAGRDIVGRDALQGWVRAFHEAFELRVDLIDEYAAGDRALVTVNLHWTHSRAPFFGIEPTGQSGTSIETFLLGLSDGMVTSFTIADHSLDLALYLHGQGMEMPRRVAPPYTGHRLSAGYLVPGDRFGRTTFRDGAFRRWMPYPPHR